MTKEKLKMSSAQIAQIMGTVGSPLIVISELLKNAVDASAKNIDVYYDFDSKSISIENDYKGFTFEEIQNLSKPGLSAKKKDKNLTNERGMFLTGSKGLGLLSVFLLCNKAEIFTSLADHSVHKITLDKETGEIEHSTLEQDAKTEYTKVVLRDVSEETISFLSSEAEVRKLRHICTSIYKVREVPFPQMQLHIINQRVDYKRSINFTCDFPQMLYDVTFDYSKKTHLLRFCCNSPNKQITNDEVTLKDFTLDGLQKIMLEKYGIKETIPTRANDLFLSDFSSVPTFEGRILVYEKSLAGAQLKTYGAGVNVYVNEFALYNYLAEENDWLGLADYSQRKKVTRLKPHNVFGYVNFPGFDENEEALRISNERADFIQDLTFSKVMYLLKGVVLFMILNIDVADKNPKYKSQEYQPKVDDEPAPHSSHCTSTTTADDSEQGERGIQRNSVDVPAANVSESSATEIQIKSAPALGTYEPSGNYSPKKLTQKSLFFTKAEGQIIGTLIGQDDLSNKIHDLTFELSKLDLQIHRHAIAYLYRALLESATKYLSRRQIKAQFNEKALESSVVSALNYFGDQCNTNKQLQNKTIRTWRDTITQRKLIDTLNQYIHNEQPVDAMLLQETWNTMKGYIIACLTVT